MKVVLASHGIFPDLLGGMERHTFHLAKTLQEEGVETHVLVPLKDRQRSFPFPVHHIDWPKKPIWLWSNYEFSKTCWQWVQENGADIAFGQGFAYWAKPNDKIPTVFHPHGLEMFGAAMMPIEKIKAWPFRHLVRKLGRESTKTISLGGQLTNFLMNRAHIPRKNISEIPNAIDEERFKDTSAKKPNHFLFVGRLAFNKGIDFLEEIIRQTQDDDFHLKIIGNGPLRNEVERIAKTNKEKIAYIPNASEEELNQSYLESEALLFMSRFEGMPTVILEAMAAECAILATDIGAVRVMVNHEVGQIMEPNPRSISENILKYLERPQAERIQLGKAGRRRVLEKFTWKAVANSYVRLFEEIKKD